MVPVAIVVASIVALLALARLAVGLAPVRVEIVGDGPRLTIVADGRTALAELPQPIVAVRPAAPVAHRREYQIDGSDSTNTLTFNASYFAALAGTPYYRFQAWLREEWRYSVWRDLAVHDGDGRLLVQQAQPPDEVFVAVPPSFRLTIALERPEIPRVLELVDASEQVLLLEVNRNDKLIRLAERRFPEGVAAASWYFPRDWRPPLATLFDLLARALALALALLLAAGLLAAALPGPLARLAGRIRARAAGPLGLVGLLGLAGLLAASLYAAVALFDRAPHVLDGIAYYFQGKTFAGGALWAPAPPVPGAFPVPFAVEHEGRWFAQYPPGTAALLAVGFLVSLPWLVQPLLAVAAAGLTVLVTARQYNRPTALLVLVLLATSPFLILQAGLFLSHVPALFFGTLVLYGVTRYAERPSAGWATLIGAGLGAVLLTREIVAALYGLTVVAVGLWRGLAGRRRAGAGRAGLVDVLVVGLLGLGAALLTLGYNAALTGSPFLLPRLLFNGRDLYGFGADIGFYGEHSVASGLVNTEQQLTALAFTLAGWPFGFSLALPLLPFLTRRWSRWDGAHGALVLAFVVAYVGYFYHGIAFGPRYYFEALPSLAILTARGFLVLARAVAVRLAAVGLSGARARARLATQLILAGLLACNLLYFLPRQVTLYHGFTGLPGGGPQLGEMVGRDLAGRVGRLDGALVVTDDWWYQVLHFAALNCPRLDCGTVFAYGPDPETRAALRQAFRDRRWYDVREQDGALRAVPGAP